MADLKTCPFCGAGAVLHKDAFDGWYSVRCGKVCGCEMKSDYKDERGAIEQWNERPGAAVELNNDLTTGNSTPLPAVATPQGEIPPKCKSCDFTYPCGCEPDSLLCRLYRVPA